MSAALGAVKHREFAMASGEMTEAEFTAFLDSVASTAGRRIARDGAIHFVCMDWRHMGELLRRRRRRRSRSSRTSASGTRTNGGMGSFYRSKHELVFVFKHGTAPHINNFELGEHGRYRTNVWDYAGINTLGAGRADELAMHPTVKPVALVADAIKDCSKRRASCSTRLAGRAPPSSRRRRPAVAPAPLSSTPNTWMSRCAGGSATPASRRCSTATGQTFEDVEAARTAANDSAVARKEVA